MIPSSHLPLFAPLYSSSRVMLAECERPARVPNPTTSVHSRPTSDATGAARAARGSSGFIRGGGRHLLLPVERASAGSTFLALPSDVGTGSQPYGMGGARKVGMSSTKRVHLAGASVPASASDPTVPAQMRAAFERTRSREERAMGLSELMSAPAADAASVLEHELTRKFQADGVIDFDERRLLKLSRLLTRETNRVDRNLRVLVCGFRVDGVASPHFRRQLRQFDQDSDPDPPGAPAQKKRAA